MINDFTIVNTNGVEIDMGNIGQLQGIEYPEVSNVFTSAPGLSGEVFIFSDYEGRVLSWEFLAETLTQRRNALAMQIGSLKTLKFTTCDSLMLQTDIEISRISMPAKRGRQKGLIQAKAPDYRLVSQALQTSSTQVTSSSGGTALPTALPMSFTSGGGGTTSLTVTNSGTAKAATEFVISGPGTGFTVQNQTTSESFFLDISILAGETLTVDTSERTILKGSTNQYGSFSGDFWELNPGDNVIYFNANSGSDVNTLLTLNYRHSYLGV